ncbi:MULTISPECIES: nicotinate-nucleotide--dimethylbenzimidazole phosphoribosyltransferase [unclassified Flavobacterium]|uniref:nicotinate-nucleotide--dimethylbenzimidazole phosphoribosyltransferase n=1 Tax=unclassified Flavobacterium TaxID=196869 RepID=UPI0013D04217|nr:MULTISPECIES: nicotinate-nucleotide--dimethylbenzimidazole phosphoribosyltransferase [unclassified Flavobacterium]MBA5792431.1 nicotinate-nucleotide--dimethylbenzimidazole phosphoribosyltransferase [Flavobacterium sp. xlx-221]
MTFEDQILQKINLKTKPLGALGYLEEIAFKIAKVQNTLNPQLTNPTQIVFAADHGLAQDGISAYPPEVTHQMVLNFLQGGAAINVFCKHNNINLKIVDAGVNFDFIDHPQLIKAKAGYGTQSSLRGKAITKDQLEFCFNESIKIVNDVYEKGCNIIGFGEMGIGNTSAASLIMATLLKIPIETCIGRGTGMNDMQLQHKTNILKEVMQFHGTITEPLDILQTFGGFEVAQMCGAMLQAYKNNMLLMIDGFIATAAFAIAHKLEPFIMNNAIFCHVSNESGHKLFLDALNQKALLDLNLRVGEGTGCALAYPIIQNAVNFLNEMASFESAGVSNK